MSTIINLTIFFSFQNIFFIETSWRLVVNRKKLRLDLSYYWESYIRKEKYCPATTTPAAAATPVSRSGYPPWVLKWGRLESSGRELISLNI